jgi:hypothetical protein
MTLHPTTIRFDKASYALIRTEAERMGMPFSQFVREAALIRSFMRALVAEEETPPDRQWVRDFARLSEEVAQRASVSPPPR